MTSDLVRVERSIRLMRGDKVILDEGLVVIYAIGQDGSAELPEFP